MGSGFIEAASVTLKTKKIEKSNYITFKNLFENILYKLTVINNK